MAAGHLRADVNPPPSQPANAVSPPYAAATINAPFPDNVYGADHGGGTLALAYPYLSPFGLTDHSRGVVTYHCAAFSPRNSEGVYGLDVWLEQQDGAGNWSAAGLHGGVPDQGTAYQPVNTPNPGPSAAYTFTWTFNQTPLPAQTNFRVFVYVYLYNQGGGSQGNFYVASTLGTVTTGAGDPPRIGWTSPFGSVNPTQVAAGQQYTISADAQDDNGDLVTVSINKNGQPFAYAGGGNGSSGNSQNPTSDSPGTETFTARAGDAAGQQTSVISWTVTVAKAGQAAVSSANASLTYYTTAFTPAYAGGSGTGGWQFVIGGATNWTGGVDSNTGTELSPSNAWSGSWTPSAPGAYTFWVVRDGDANVNPSAISSAYTLTVTPAAPVGAFDGIAPTAGAPGQTVSGSGWAADAQVGAALSQVQITVDGGANGTLAATLGGSRPDVQAANLGGGHWSPANLTPSGWSFSLATTGLGLGTHTLTAVAYDNAYGVSAVLGSKTFTLSATATTFTAAPLVLTYSGSRQSPALASSPAAAVTSGSYAISGTAAATAVGAYAFTVTANGSYTGSNLIHWIINTAGQAPVFISPVSAAITAGQSVNFTASGGSGTGNFTWSGAAAGSGPSATVGFSTPGTYSVSVTKAGDTNYQASSPATATVTVAVPSYTLTTYAVGNGSVTPGGTYPANTVLSVFATPGTNASFAGWTGSLSSGSNPLGITLTGNLTIYGNFFSLQSQTIAFSPPASAFYPGAAIGLSATATSGLPVSFALLSGPATLSGNQLALTGTGVVAVRASQSGNATWLPAPSVDRSITVNALTTIARLRFNPLGHDARVTAGRPGDALSPLWTDPTGLLNSPWPSFANPASLPPASVSFALPAPPAAPVQSR